MKYISLIKGFASGICFGLGQLLNKQYWKALFFFVVFISAIGIEVATSNYGTETQPYDKISESNYAPTFYTYYYYSNDDLKGKKGYDPELEVYYNEVTDNGSNEEAFNEEAVIKYIAKNLKESSAESYTNAITSTEVLKEDFSLNETKNTSINYHFYEKDGTFYRKFTEKSDNSDYYLEIDILTGQTINDNKVSKDDSFVHYYFKSDIGVDTDDNSYFSIYTVNSKNEQEKLMYLNINTKEIIEASNSITKVSNSYNIVLKTENGKYVPYFHYQPGLYVSGQYTQYKGNQATETFKAYVENVYNQSVNSIYKGEHYQKLLLMIYFELEPEVKADFEERFDNFFYDKAGLFVKSYWSVITLGQSSNASYSEFQALEEALLPKNVDISESTVIMGHVSVLILLEGLIGVILSVFFIIIGIWSVKDAYRVSNKKLKNEVVLDGKEYFKELYEDSFEYIVLSPVIFVLAFITIMPLIFGFVMAFTSVSGDKYMIEKFDWIGFKNFFVLFDFSSGLGASFGVMFWKVLAWTILWAVLTTGTVFFGGLFQALILNSNFVVFRKFWRCILILPWAMPALLSQMVFGVIFKEAGLINQIVENLGFYDIFINLGILGTTENPLVYETLNGLQKFFYLGPTAIRWFTNTNNIVLVRTTLIVVNIWLGFPYFMALMSGVMTSIDKSLYEASEIDGASKFQQLRFITLPLVLYSTAPILIMTFSGNFNNFGVIYFITEGGPNNGYADRAFAGDTDILISWMYKLTVDQKIFNMASVFSVLIFIVVGSVTAWNLSRTRAFMED